MMGLYYKQTLEIMQHVQKYRDPHTDCRNHLCSNHNQRHNHCGKIQKKKNELVYRKIHTD